MQSGNPYQTREPQYLQTATRTDPSIPLGIWMMIDQLE